MTGVQTCALPIFSRSFSDGRTVTSLRMVEDVMKMGVENERENIGGRR